MLAYLQSVTVPVRVAAPGAGCSGIPRPEDRCSFGALLEVSLGEGETMPALLPHPEDDPRYAPIAIGDYVSRSTFGRTGRVIFLHRYTGIRCSVHISKNL